MPLQRDRHSKGYYRLKEKLHKLKLLDNEILALVNDDAVEEEIEQADVFSERLYQSIISVDFLSLLSSLSIEMRKQFQPDHNISSIQLYEQIYKSLYMAEGILCNCLEANSVDYNPGHNT